MMLWTKKKRSRPVSPVQRLCGFCFALFVFFQTPLFTLPIKREEKIIDVPFSAVEVAAIGVNVYYEEYAQSVQAFLLPGIWWKLLSRQVFACMSGSPSCSPARLVDIEALKRACDYQHMVEPYLQATGSAGSILAVSSSMLLACAVAMPVVPDLVVSVVALVLFVWSIFQTGCTPLPTILFMAMLCATSVFGTDRQPPTKGTTQLAEGRHGKAAVKPQDGQVTIKAKGPATANQSANRKKR